MLSEHPLILKLVVSILIVKGFGRKEREGEKPNI